MIGQEEKWRRLQESRAIPRVWAWFQQHTHMAYHNQYTLIDQEVMYGIFQAWNKIRRGIPDCFAGLSGDFDDQGLSFGVLQWNFGQGSLQPLLRDMINGHREVTESIFQSNLGVLEEALDSEREEMMLFVRSIQHPIRHYLYEPWGGMFKSLGRTREFQNIQTRYASGLYNSALALCEEYGLWSERAVALMFDIKVQNGSISKLVKSRIFSDFSALPGNPSDEDREVRKMRAVAIRRSEAANPRWIDDVKSRKLCIANGGGEVHNIDFDLEEQFGIRLASFKR